MRTFCPFFFFLWQQKCLIWVIPLGKVYIFAAFSFIYLNGKLCLCFYAGKKVPAPFSNCSHRGEIHAIYHNWHTRTCMWIAQNTALHMQILVWTKQFKCCMLEFASNTRGSYLHCQRQQIAGCSCAVYREGKQKNRWHKNRAHHTIDINTACYHSPLSKGSI